MAFAAVVLSVAAGPSLAQEATSSAFSGLNLSGKDPIQIESDRLEVVEAESRRSEVGHSSSSIWWKNGRGVAGPQPARGGALWL